MRYKNIFKFLLLIVAFLIGFIGSCLLIKYFRSIKTLNKSFQRDFLSEKFDNEVNPNLSFFSIISSNNEFQIVINKDLGANKANGYFFKNKDTLRTNELFKFDFEYDNGLVKETYNYAGISDPRIENYNTELNVSDYLDSLITFRIDLKDATCKTKWEKEKGFFKKLYEIPDINVNITNIESGKIFIKPLDINYTLSNISLSYTYHQDNDNNKTIDCTIQAKELNFRLLLGK